MPAGPTPATAAAASKLLSRIPGVVTSIFRPTGSHMWGAIDIAPRFQDGIGLYHLKVKGCQVPVLRDVLLKLGPELAPGVQVYLEGDHFHIHDTNILPVHLREPLPPGRTFVEHLPGCTPRCASCVSNIDVRQFERIY